MLPYIQEFTKTGLNEAIKDLDFDVNTYISEAELEKLINEWTKIRNGQGFINNFSKDASTASKDSGWSNFYNSAKQLTKFFAKLLQQETRTITDQTVKKLTKKKFGGAINIPTFYYGGFVNVNKV